MSLYTLVKTVLESNGWKVPTSAVSSSGDENIKQIFALANKELVSLSWGRNWPVLIKDYSFTTVIGQAEYPLPTDFHHLLNPSVYDSTQFYALKGNLQPLEFIRYVNNQVSVNNPAAGYRIKQRGKKFVIVPTPYLVDNLTFFYLSRNLVVDAAGNDKPIYSQDDDIAIVDEDMLELGLTWRWREKKGLDFSAEIMEYNAAVAQRYAQYIALPEFPIGGRAPYDAPLTEGYVQGPLGP